MDGEKTMKCGRCEETLVKRQIRFSYMNRSFGHEVPTCPKCGRPYISRALAEGKMAEVEIMLEDK